LTCDWVTTQISPLGFVVSHVTEQFAVVVNKILLCICWDTFLLIGVLQEMVGTHVVDGVMEDIRLGMEVNLPKYSQRRVAMIKYLGELYNYRMVESSDIFKVTSHVFFHLMVFIISTTNFIQKRLLQDHN
jgi:hypothetical protein